MLLCRPFFRRTIFHWHAAGLAEWLESRAKPWERWLSRRLLGQAHLSVVLSQFNRRDAELLAARACKIVPNGIPDPCPDFDKVILPRRQARLEARRRILAGEIPTKAEREAAGGDPQLFHVLFLSLCTREKGLFDALDAVALLNQKLAAGDTGVRVKLEVAGEFHTEADRAEFAERIARPDLHLPWINHPASNETASPTGGFSAVEYCGFVSGPAKQRLFGRTDAFCFPTYYQAESFGIVLVEAMAFGVPIVTTRWRAVPELFPATYPGLVEPRRPDKVAAVLETFLQGYDGTSLRSRFLENYTLKQYLDGLAEAFRCVAAE
jgi:glycosyltransferase involved in cell wall biosynthesis